MAYNLIKKSFGIASISKIANINVDFEITNICYVENRGFYFLARNKHCIGLFDLKGRVIFPLVGEVDISGNVDGMPSLFNNPSSICFSKKLNSLFIVENKGESIRKLDFNMDYVSTVIQGKEIEKICGFFSKLKGSSMTSCDINDRGDIVWAARDINRIFKYNKGLGQVDLIMGNGRKSFFVSNRLIDCTASNPSGIKYTEDSIIFCETGSHCIRNIKNNSSSIVIGNPSRAGDKDGKNNECLLAYPYGLKYNSGIVYFLDNQKIKQLALSDKSVSTIKEFKNNVLLEIDKKNLFILEKI